MAKKETMNKDDFRRNVEAIYNKGDVHLVNLLFAPNFVIHNPSQEDIRDHEVLKQGVRDTRIAFPDLQVTIEDIVIEGDILAMRRTFRGTHKGPLKVPGGMIPPTNKQITVSSMAFARFKDGKVVEAFEVRDSLGFVQQLGLAR